MRQTRLKRKLILVLSHVIKVLTIVLIVIALLQAYKQLFTIKTVSCSQNSQPCPSSILTELDRFIGKSILTFNKQHLETKITGSNPNYTQVSISPSLPGKIDLTLALADVIAQVTTASPSGYLQVSTDFTIISHSASKAPDVKTIISPQATQLAIGNQINISEITNAIKLAQQLKLHFIDFTTITAISPTLATTTTSGNISVSFDPTKAIKNQIVSLQLISSQITDKPISTIDLRYTKPIITYK